MNNKTFYDSKIIMIDMNFHFIDDGNENLLTSIQKTLKKLTAAQNLILLTDCTIDFCIKKIENWNLTSGYLVANSGSVLYNLATKTIVSSVEFEKSVIKQLIKQSIWKNLNFVINTKDNLSYVYQLNTWLIDRYKFDLNKLFELEKNNVSQWIEMLKIIDENTVLSIEILFYEKDDDIRKESMEKFIELAKSLGEFDYSMNDPTIFMFSKKCSKLITSKEIAKQKNIDFDKNSLYIGIDQLSEDLINESYFSVVYDKLLNYKQLEVESNYETIETIIASEDNWMDWITQNDHLWTENAVDTLTKMLHKYKYLNFKPSEETDLQNNKQKFLNLDDDTEEISLHTTYTKTYSWYKKENVDEKSKIKKLFFWDHQLDLILNLLKNKKHH